ncbi:MAG: leucyl/phenylalanyl-tRNA--protein transferase, partial [Bryobacteraceae bacterium]
MDVVRTTKILTPADVEPAYRAGIFPMAGPMADSDHAIITWHKPKRRAVLPLETFHASLTALLRRRPFGITFDHAFADVVDACADRPSTWINSEIKAVYGQLHAQGKAHSVEVWVDGELVGGLYGVHLGGAFFAESMFHRRTNMSKVALAELVAWLRERGFALLEVQYLREHLAQFGVIEISDRKYQARLKEALELPCSFGGILNQS